MREVASDNSRTITYSSSGYAAAGTIELLDGAYPEFVDSTAITQFTGSGGPLEFTSSAIDARPGINNNTALHTIAIYPQDFTGTVVVQATMASTPSDSDFVTITSTTLSSASTPSTLNFTGVFHSVRFSWDNDPDNTGKIDKILYRQ